MPQLGDFSIPDPIGQGALLQFDPTTRTIVAFIPFLNAMESGRGALGLELKPPEKPHTTERQAIERSLKSGSDRRESLGEA